MTHVLSADAQAARSREAARIWLRQLAQLIYPFGFREAYSRIDTSGATICLRDDAGHDLHLRVYASQWKAWIAQPRQAPGRLQTGGNCVPSLAVLEDAQRLVHDRCIKPIR